MASPSKMGFWGLFAVLVSLQLGSGLFILPSSLAPYGGWGLLSWVISGLGALSLAHVFSQLSLQFPKASGGPHGYVKQIYGDRAGFYMAWSYWTVTWLSSTTLVATIATYCLPFLPVCSPLGILATQLVIVILAGILNLYGLQLASWVEVALSTLKVVILLGLPLYGIFFIHWENYVLNPHDTPVYEALKVCVFFTFWGFIGLEAGTTGTEAVQNPSQTIPQATRYATFFIACLYVFNTFVLFGLLPYASLASSSPYGAAAAILWGSGLERLVSGCIAVMCFGTLHGVILISGQIAQSAAQSGLFHSVMARKNSWGSPAWSIIISCGGLIPFLLFMMNDSLLSQIEIMIEMAVSIYIIIYAVCLAIYIRSEKLSLLDKITGFWGGCFCLFMLWNSGMSAVVAAVSVLFVGRIIEPFWRQVNLTSPSSGEKHRS